MTLEFPVGDHPAGKTSSGRSELAINRLPFVLKPLFLLRSQSWLGKRLFNLSSAVFERMILGLEAFVMPAIKMRSRVRDLTLCGLQLIPVSCAVLLHHRTAEQIVQFDRERDTLFGRELVSIHRLSQHDPNLLPRRFFRRSKNWRAQQQTEHEQSRQWPPGPPLPWHSAFHRQRTGDCVIFHCLLTWQKT